MFDYGKYLKRLQGGDLSINPFLAFMGMTLEALGDGSARFRMPVGFTSQEPYRSLSITASRFSVTKLKSEVIITIPETSGILY